MTATLIARAAKGDTDGVIQPDKAQILLDGEMVPQGEFQLVIASSLDRLFLKMNPFWGEGDGGVRFSSIAAGAPGIAKAVPGLLAGRPPRHVTAENGYTSRNVECAEMRIDCGFTVDGEIYAENSDEVVSITADRRLRFVRA